MVIMLPFALVFMVLMAIVVLGLAPFVAVMLLCGWRPGTESDDIKDAQRYRWLKRMSPETVAPIAWRRKAACQFPAEELDKCIDAAIEEETNDKESP